jgi:hypothetical protein
MRLKEKKKVTEQFKGLSPRARKTLGLTFFKDEILEERWVTHTNFFKAITYICATHAHMLTYTHIYIQGRRNRPRSSGPKRCTKQTAPKLLCWVHGGRTAKINDGRQCEFCHVGSGVGS